MDYQGFVNGKRTKLISPAGYGKTHTIVESLKHTNGKQLILTHTHAGISSIKEKIKNSNIESSTYKIETISSFAQKYVHAFCCTKCIPEQESKDYHPFLTKKATQLFNTLLVKKIIASSYKGLFVDEYQDCTKDQHIMLFALSNILPTHILGDPLQGIFDINGDAVDFEIDLVDFEEFPELATPQRWYGEGNNRALGEKLREYREILKCRQPIELVDNKNIGFYVIKTQENDILNSNSLYRKSLDKLIKNPDKKSEFDSLLIIMPEYIEKKSDNKHIPKGGINHRAQIRSLIDYSKSLKLLEAIDDKSFYSVAKKADLLIKDIARAKNKVIKLKKDILDPVFQKTDLDIWFNQERLKNKESDVDNERSQAFNSTLVKFIGSPSARNLQSVILHAKDHLKLKWKRDEIIFGLLRALSEADQNKLSVYESMKHGRNHIRRSGREIYGKCIGTTRLTKGLEFDTVAILDAHKFDCPKHLYVAMTRCCKNLIIFTEETTLSAYV